VDRCKIDVFEEYLCCRTLRIPVCNVGAPRNYNCFLAGRDILRLLVFDSGGFGFDETQTQAARTSNPVRPAFLDLPTHTS